MAEWQPIETAPKSPAKGKHVQGIYLLGFCPDPDTCNLESAICVIWWEPLMNKGRGMWYGEGGYEVKPTHWQPLPAPPGVKVNAPSVEDRLKMQSGPFKGKPQGWFTRDEVLAILATYGVSVPDDQTFSRQPPMGGAA